MISHINLKVIYNDGSSKAYIEVVVNGITYQSEIVSIQDEWVEVSIDFVMPLNVHIAQVKLIKESSLTSYFDHIYINDGYVDQRLNLVDQGSLETEGIFINGSWSKNNTNDITIESYIGEVDFQTYADYMFLFGEHALKFDNANGNYLEASYGLVDLDYENLPAKLVIGSWSYVDYTSVTSMSHDDYYDMKCYGIRVDFLDTLISKDDPNYALHVMDHAYISFDSTVDDVMQYVKDEINVPLETEFIYVNYVYSGAGVVYFDNLEVYANPVFTYHSFNDDTGQKIYQADPYGKMTVYSYKDLSNRPVGFKVYDSQGRIESSLDSEVSSDYLVTDIKVNNIISTTTKNQDGQVTSIKIGEGSLYTISYTDYYTYNNQFVSKTTNEYGDRTWYYYNELTGLLDAIQNEKGDVLEYTYYANGMLKTVTNPGYSVAGDQASVMYQYNEEGQLTHIFLENDFYYEITYDQMGRMSQVYIKSDTASESLMSYDYVNDHGYETNRIENQTYGNGDEIKFDYNDQEQLEALWYKESGTSTYKKQFGYLYNNEGLISAYHTYDEMGDVIETEYYTYNMNHQLIQMVDTHGNKSEFLYDSLGNLYEVNHLMGGISNQVSYDLYEMMELDRDDLDENLYMEGQLNLLNGLIERVQIASDFEVLDGVFEIATYESGAGFFFGDLMPVIGSSTYQFELTTTASDLNDSFKPIKLMVLKYSYDTNGLLAYDGYAEVISDVGLGYNTGSLTIDSDVVGIRVFVYSASTFHIIFDDLVMDYDGLEQVQRYQGASYTSANGYDVMKDYQYENNVLQRLNTINLTNTHFNLNQTFGFSGNTSRIDEINYILEDPYQNQQTMSYNYTYDDIGNIIEIDESLNGVLINKTTYLYDEMNQLIVEAVNDFSSCDIYSDSCYQIYYHYDLRGDLVEVKTYAYGEAEAINIQCPEAYLYNAGSEAGYVVYNGSYTYDDIYELNVGDTPSLSFQYKDLYTNAYILGLQTTLISDNLDNQTEGYYERVYEAKSKWSPYIITFKIIIKVGQPQTSYENIPFIHEIYTYDDMWLDQLISHETYTYDLYDQLIDTKDKTYAYDLQGNPTFISDFYYEEQVYDEAYLSYLGRDLMSITLIDDIYDDVIMTYTYNDQGYRTSKTVDGITTSYELNGDQVIYETDGIYDIIYTYDIDGTIISYQYDDGDNQEEIYYVRNLQNDITDLISETGIILVSYTYDAYGKIIDVRYNQSYQDEAEQAHLYNRYFYRGYRYDEEVNLYYLNSRYYDPELRRFMSADGLLGSVGDLLGHNMYAYTYNNPVMYTDPSGYFALAIVIVFSLTIIEIIKIVAIVVLVSAIFLEWTNDFYYTKKMLDYFETSINSRYSRFKDYIIKTKQSKKARSTDKPSYVNKDMIDKKLTAKENARNIMDSKWGSGNWNKGPGSDYNKILKWIVRGEQLRIIVNFFSDENNVKNVFDYQIYRRTTNGDI